MTQPGRLINDDDGIRDLLQRTRRIAVLGIKPESRMDRPAFFVPQYLSSVGYEIVPVPVYYPQVTSILGSEVYRTLSAIPGPVDIVEVFRRPEHVPAHVSDIVAKRPGAVWLQSGIRHDQVAQQLVNAGISVVQDRCMMTDHRQLLAV
jgi:hypothetical protein